MCTLQCQSHGHHRAARKLVHSRTLRHVDLMHYILCQGEGGKTGVDVHAWMMKKHLREHPLPLTATASATAAATAASDASEAIDRPERNTNTRPTQTRRLFTTHLGEVIIGIARYSPMLHHSAPVYTLYTGMYKPVHRTHARMPMYIHIGCKRRLA